jgi:outer membrane murein-binding lipoprotein Lpp
MDRPPPPPPGEPPTGEPTGATRPLGTPVEREVVPAEREVVLDPALAEKIDSASFWSKVGSAIAVLAAIIGVIALVLALDARNDDSGSADAGLREDVAQLRGDVDALERQTDQAGEAGQDVNQLSSRVSRLQGQVEQLSEDQQQVTEDVSTLQQDLSELSDRVDQVEQAQEDAAAGGP